MNRILNRTSIIFIVLIMALLAAGCTLASEPVPAGPIESGPLPGEVLPGEEAAADPSAAVPISRPDAGNGQSIYFENCVRCHGPEGAGDGEFSAELAEQGGELPPLSDPQYVRTRSPQDWFAVITSGNMAGLMPPWEGTLSASQRWDATYFLYSFTVDEETLETGQALYEEHFAELYGENGEEIGLDNLATVAELSQQDIFTQYVEDADADLSEEEMWAVAAYMQTFGYSARQFEVAEAEPEESSAEESPDEETQAEDETPAEEDAAEESGDSAEDESDAPAEDAADEIEDGTVRGQVLMGSPHADLPGDLEVQLSGIAVDSDNQVFEFLTRTAPLNEDGTVTFEDVPFDVDRSAYVIAVTYNGVEFTNGRLIEPGMTEIDLPLTLYESTTDTDVVEVAAMHVVMRQHPDTLLVTQMMVYSNTSDKIFVSDEPVSGGRRGSVALKLPPDAYSISFEEGQLGGRFVAQGDMIYDTQQIRPGDQSHAIIVNYFLPFDGSRDVEIPVMYNTDRVTVLMQEGPRVRSEQVTEAGVQNMGDAIYEQYTGQTFEAGDTLSLRVAPEGGFTQLLPTIGLAFAGALLIVGGVYWYIQRQGDAGPAFRAEAGLTGEGQALMEEIAELDEAYKAGKINQFEYEQRRTDLKAALAEHLADSE